MFWPTGLLYDKTRSPSAVFYVLAGVCGTSALLMLLLPVLGRVEPGLRDAKDQPEEV